MECRDHHPGHDSTPYPILRQADHLVEGCGCLVGEGHQILQLPYKQRKQRFSCYPADSGGMRPQVELAPIRVDNCVDAVVDNVIAKTAQLPEPLKIPGKDAHNGRLDTRLVFLGPCQQRTEPVSWGLPWFATCLVTQSICNSVTGVADGDQEGFRHAAH